ncbi:MAG: zinc ribbon domain-containing protein [Betaproteobacteria bacterium]|nr:zinc ribbon domain-containing protein [Betaproteobacteria bacterium]
MAFCPNCDAEVADDALKCTKCGATFGPGSAWQPSLTKRSRASETDGGPVYFSVSCSKFAVLSTLTLLIYTYYWFYQNWRFEKKDTGENLWPLPRTIFAPFFAYFLFDAVRAILKRHDLPVFDACLLALVFFAFNITWGLPDPYWLVSVFAFMPILPIQAAINQLNAKIAPDAPRNDRYTAANIVVIVIGVVFWLLILAGMFFPENADALR